MEVELPELQPFAPWQFLDTPGLGSAWRHNTEVALSFLPPIDAALAAIAADAPLSGYDLALFQQLFRHTPWIALLLTKADRLTEVQRAQVLACVQRLLPRTQNKGLPAFFYSIRPDEPDFKTTQVNHWIRPLLQHHADAAGRITRYQLSSLRDELLNYPRVALVSATRAESARSALPERLAEERRPFDLFRAELTLFARTLAARALEDSLEHLRPVQRTLQGRVTTELQGQFSHSQLRLPLLLKAWRRWLQECLRRELTEVSGAERP